MTSTNELSCYSTALAGYLRRGDPTAPLRVARAIRTAVRVDLPSHLEFSHHERVDHDDSGRMLVYRSAAGWAETRAALTGAVQAYGAVLAVGNARFLPWSPHHGRSAVPHWIQLDAERDGDWHVTDDFDALLPCGTQRPFDGWLDDAALRTALTPVGPLAREIEARERYALGTAATLPPTTHYRWLDYAAQDHHRDQGEWLTEPEAVLGHLTERLAEDDGLLARQVDDLWAVARHQVYRLRTLADAGELPPATAHRAADCWSGLPRALRLAAESAARGRRRPGTVRRAFAGLPRTEGVLA